MKKRLFSILKFCLLFFVIFLILMFFGHIFSYPDSINTYGFSYALYKGQIPYLEFNTITTPLYAFYQSLFLYIYNDSLMLMVSQTLLVTINFILLYKLFGKKAFLFLLLIFVVRCSNVAFSYNYMCFFIMTLFVFVEKKFPNRDILSGLILGLLFLTKHTVGCVSLLILVILNYKDIKKLSKKIIGFLIPCFIFFVYLLINGALYQFLDLCFFGLFDFLNKNGVGGGAINIGAICLLLFTVVCSLFILIKHKNDKLNFYMFAGLFLTIPVIDYFHVFFWLNCFLVIVLPYINFDYKFIKLGLFFISSVVGIYYSLLFYNLYSKSSFCFSSGLNHFKYNYVSVDLYEKRLNNIKYVNSYEDPIIISGDSVRFSIINDRKLSYFDIFLDGNFGYNGNNKMMRRVDELHDQIFIVAKNEVNSVNMNDQFANEVYEYIISVSKKIASNDYYNVYYKE